MIGNDLVYLPHWPQRESWRRQRFRQKVYHESEISWLREFPDSDFGEALLWAAKEAVYKVRYKLDLQRLYNPKSHRIFRLSTTEKGYQLMVESGDQTYRVKAVYHNDYLHAITQSRETVVREYWTPAGNENPRLPFNILKDEQGVPWAYSGSACHDCSVSQDGHYRVVVVGGRFEV